MKILPSFLVTTFLVGVATIASAKPIRTDAERVQMHETYDTNKDGKLDDGERAARRTARIAERFAKLDTNSDGSISRDEFVAGADARQAHRKAEQADDAKAGKGKHGNKGKHVKRGRRAAKKTKAV